MSNTQQTSCVDTVHYRNIRENTMSKNQRTCTICGSPYLEHTHLQTKGDIWAKIFGSLNKTVTAEFCVNCGYTEMYKRHAPEQKYTFAFSLN
jgi:predicted nucleic-acid-binding Zn-ribbon protein